MDDTIKEKIHFEEYHYPELSEITVAIESMNEEIGENLNQLEKQKQIRQEFFSNASHELKTPLTSIMGYTELLRTHTRKYGFQIIDKKTGENLYQDRKDHQAGVNCNSQSN